MTQDLMSLDIFEFEDPNTDDAPIMRLRAPWQLDADLVRGVDLVTVVGAKSTSFYGTDNPPAFAASDGDIYTNVITKQTWIYQVSAWALQNDVTAPTTPGSVVVSARASGACLVSFNGSTDTETGVATYRIFRRLAGDSSAGGAVVDVPHTGAVSYSVEDSSSVPGLTYQYAVEAADYAGNSAKSAWTTAVAPVVTDGAVTAASLVDGAISRLKLNVDFVTEHNTVITGLASEVNNRVAAVAGVQTQVTVLQPKVMSLEDLSAWAEDLLVASDKQFLISEQSIRLEAVRTDALTTQVGFIEIDIDSIEAVVAEIGPLTTRVGAVEIDVGSVTATVALMEPDVAKIAQIELDLEEVTIYVADYSTTKSRVSTLEVGLDAIELTVADLFGETWQPSTVYALNDLVHENGNAYKVTTAGTSGTSEPTWPESGTVSDNTVVWTYQGTYVADLTQLQLNTDHIAGIVADGGYYDDADPPVFHPTLAYTTAVQTAEDFTLFIGSATSLESWSLQFATKEEIVSMVVTSDLIPITDDISDLEEGLAGVPADIAAALVPVEGRVTVTETDISVIEQTVDEISFQVVTLWSGTAPPQISDRDAYLAWLEDAYVATSSGVLIAEQKVAIEVQDRTEMGVVLSASIVVEADRITSEVSRAVEAEGTLATQIVQTADAINLTVFGATEEPPVGYDDLVSYTNASLQLRDDSITALVTSGSSAAIMSLAVMLPAAMLAARYAAVRAAVVTAGGNPLSLDAAYETATIAGVTHYVVKPTATPTVIETARAVLRTAGQLGSQIALQADEIFLDGVVSGSNMVLDAAFIASLEATEIDAKFLKSQTIVADMIDTTELHVDFLNIDGTVTADAILAASGKVRIDAVSTLSGESVWDDGIKVSFTSMETLADAQIAGLLVMEDTDVMRLGMASWSAADAWWQPLAPAMVFYHESSTIQFLADYVRMSGAAELGRADEPIKVAYVESLRIENNSGGGGEIIGSPTSEMTMDSILAGEIAVERVLEAPQGGFDRLSAYDSLRIPFIGTSPTGRAYIRFNTSYHKLEYSYDEITWVSMS